jgi:hypothetical protein
MHHESGEHGLVLIECTDKKIGEELVKKVEGMEDVQVQFMEFE